MTFSEVESLVVFATSVVVILGLVSARNVTWRMKKVDGRSLVELRNLQAADKEQWIMLWKGYLKF